MTVPSSQRSPREAGPDLLVLQRFEELTGWLLAHTGRWAKSARFTLAQRVQNHALDVLELLVEARYEPSVRRERLHAANLRLERMRFLCRIARDAGVMPKRGFESAMRGLDEAGRMLYGWRRALEKR